MEMDLPINNLAYGDLEYWNKRFETEEQYDWFAGYTRFRHLVLESVEKSDKILMLGCGNSTLSAEMYADGYQNITNLDYSDVVISHMSQKYRDLAEMAWVVGDIRDLQFPAGSFDVVMEKGTLDALLVGETDPWNTSPESREMIDSICRQIVHVLKPEGKFISVSFAQPHFRKRLLALDCYGWGIRTLTFGESFHYFYYVMTRGGRLEERDKVWSRPTVTEEEEEVGNERYDEDGEQSEEDEDFLFKIS